MAMGRIDAATTTSSDPASGYEADSLRVLLLPLAEKVRGTVTDEGSRDSAGFLDGVSG